MFTCFVLPQGTPKSNLTTHIISLELTSINYICLTSLQPLFSSTFFFLHIKETLIYKFNLQKPKKKIIYIHIRDTLHACIRYENASWQNSFWVHEYVTQNFPPKIKDLKRSKKKNKHVRHTHPAREVAHKGIKNLKNPKTNYIYSQLDFYDEAEGSHKLLRSIKTKSSLWKISTQNLCKRSSLSYPSVPVMTLMQLPFSLSRTHTLTWSFSSLTRVVYTHSLICFLGNLQSH